MSVDTISAHAPSSRRRLLIRVVRQPIAGAAAVFLVLLVAIAVAAPWLVPFDPVRNDLSNTFADPGRQHLLGTDELGRDVFSRLLVAARVSLFASFLAVGVAVIVGFPLGLIAGLRGGRFERWVMRISDGLMAMPGLIIIIAVIAVFGSSLTAAMITLGVVLSPSILRIVRASALSVRQELFVDAARTLGLRQHTIARRHVLPQVMPPLIVQVSLTWGIALLAEAGLSFLGLGVQPPQPSWGGMLARATSYIYQHPILVLPPGIAITLTVLALNLLGDGIRDEIGAGIRRRRPRHRRMVVVPSGDSGSPTDASSVVDVRNLSIGFPNDDHEVTEVVTDVSFEIQPGEIVGLVGESGCGKSVTALSLIGLVPHPGHVTAGSIRLDGNEIVGRPDRVVRRLRGPVVGLVFQDPMSSLDPSFTIGDQLAEPLRLHLGLSRRHARRRAVELLEQVGIPDAPERVRAFPHEFSGGMAQRVMIAAALAANPRVLIADEPTTALDVTVQAEILDLLRTLAQERKMAVLLVTHDLGVIADLCERAIVMYAGEIVENAHVTDLFRRPQHPYTQALLEAVPRAGSEHQDRLRAIPGTVPPPQLWPKGCRFAERCHLVTDDCRAAPVELTATRSGATRCIMFNESTSDPLASAPS